VDRLMGFLDAYEPVEDRLREFWKDHPNGRIETHLDHHGDGDYIVRAVIFRDIEEAAASTGYAHDSVAQLPANMKSSALEVCETSAIGRALANLGYAPKGKRPSREEMSKSSPAQSASPETATTTAASTARSERAPVAGDSSAYGEGAGNEGEPGSAMPGSPSPHPDQPHEWKPSPKLSKYEICALPDCYASRKKGEAA
jgi:hypothetical protein